MNNQPEALRLAKALEQGKYLLSVERDATAAELRRLYQLCMDQQGEIYALNMARSMEQKTANLVAAAERQRQQLTDEQISDLWHQSGEQPFKFARMLVK